MDCERLLRLQLVQFDGVFSKHFPGDIQGLFLRDFLVMHHIRERTCQCLPRAPCRYPNEFFPIDEEHLRTEFKTVGPEEDLVGRDLKPTAYHSAEFPRIKEKGEG